MELQVKALKLKNRMFDSWHTQVQDPWDYEDFLKSDVQHRSGYLWKIQIK